MSMKTNEWFTKVWSFWSIMHVCCYFSRSPDILVDLQFVFINLLIFCDNQMHFAFVFWFKKQKRRWPDIAAFVAKAQTRVAILMFGLLVCKKEAPIIHASSNPVQCGYVVASERLWLHFFLKFMQLRFSKCNCFWFWVFCCEVSNYFFSGYNQDNQECYY